MKLELELGKNEAGRGILKAVANDSSMIYGDFYLVLSGPAVI